MRQIKFAGLTAVTAATALSLAFAPVAFAAGTSAIDGVETSNNINADSVQQQSVSFEMQEVEETITLSIPKKVSGVALGQDASWSAFNPDGKMAAGSSISIVPQEENVDVSIGFIKLTANDTTNGKIAINETGDGLAVAPESAVDVDMVALPSFLAEMASGTQTYVLQVETA